MKIHGVGLTDADGTPGGTSAPTAVPRWQADESDPEVHPLPDKVKHRMTGFYDQLITDEVHEYRVHGSAQAIAAGILADACGFLSLSATLMRGCNSTLFHLLYRLSPGIRFEFRHFEQRPWIERYRFIKHPIGKPHNDSMEDGRNSRRMKFRKAVREKPGHTASALFHFLANTVFLRLSDMASECLHTLSGLSYPRWTRKGATGYFSAAPTTPCLRSREGNWPSRSRAAPRGCSPTTCNRSFARKLAASRKPLLTLDSPANENLGEMGATGVQVHRVEINSSLIDTTKLGSSHAANI